MLFEGQFGSMYLKFQGVTLWTIKSGSEDYPKKTNGQTY